MSVSQRLLGQRLFEFSARCTFYGHFIAGNGEVEAKELVRKFKNAGVATILSITAEEDVGESQDRFASDIFILISFILVVEPRTLRKANLITELAKNQMERRQ